MTLFGPALLTTTVYALVVPVEAIQREDEQAFVMIAGADKKAHKRQVTVGMTTAKEAELTGGVKAGEAVIVKGQQELPDGADITIGTADDGKTDSGKKDDKDDKAK